MIHIEQQWEENVLTVEGGHIHRIADQPLIREKRGDKLIVRALPVRSRRLGVSGVCDVVEFVRHPEGISLAGEEGLYLPFPVEYKRGKPKKDDSDRSQLIAQLMCLEEMLVCELSLGYLYYDEIKHRVEVPVTPADKERVSNIFEEMRHYYQKRHTPKVKTGPHCRSCSLSGICLPEMMSKRTVSSYIESRLEE